MLEKMLTALSTISILPTYLPIYPHARTHTQRTRAHTRAHTHRENGIYLGKTGSTMTLYIATSNGRHVDS